MTNPFSKNPSDTPPARLEIKKYPNRRFYDVTRSRHVTLEDLYGLVRDGCQIVVTDSKTGADISNVVLTQIILEHDPPKLDLFPPALLHQAIQSNQQMIRQFIDRYFAQAMDAFVSSRRNFDDFLAKSGFSALSTTAPLDWVRMLLPANRWRPDQPAGTPPPNQADAPAPPDSLHQLHDQIASLSAEVESLRNATRRTGTKQTRANKPKGPRKKRG